ncbi:MULTISPECIES: hypothetical protein [Nonomuraea]|uniref:hypothetical protein n=1 Tax=Nonomuraea TaxID=83681 RepID=UPI0031EF0E00
MGRHLLAAERALEEDDPDKAHEHTKVARRFAARIGVVREAAGIVAYRAGHFSEALSDLRAARRMTGSEAYLPVMADCERGMGRPERALDLVRSPEAERLDRAGRIELTIVESGARRDLGQHDAAVITLQRLPELRDPQPRPWSARLAFAYADALEEAGHHDAAVDWFGRAVAFDEDGETDAAERYAELTGATIEDVEEGYDEDFVSPGDAASEASTEAGGEGEPEARDAGPAAQDAGKAGSEAEPDAPRAEEADHDAEQGRSSERPGADNRREQAESVPAASPEQSGDDSDSATSPEQARGEAGTSAERAEGESDAATSPGQPREAGTSAERAGDESVATSPERAEGESTSAMSPGRAREEAGTSPEQAGGASSKRTGGAARPGQTGEPVAGEPDAPTDAEHGKQGGASSVPISPSFIEPDFGDHAGDEPGKQSE